MSKSTPRPPVLRSFHFWGIAILTAFLGVIYYADWLGLADWIPFGKAFLSEEYLHDIHRALLLIPMLYGAVAFRLRGAIVMSLACLCIVLPRAVAISPYPDALARAFIFVAVASLATVLLGLEQERRASLNRAYGKLGAVHSELENSSGLLRASEERYRNLFQGASEAIFISDPNGAIVEANTAAVALVGYSLGELQSMGMQQLLARESTTGASEAQPNWIKGEHDGKYHEERLIRKDGSGVTVELAAQAIHSAGQDIAVQTIARDVTEERRLRENMQFYIREVTQAQEEERKRIARELHDETAQGLAVLALDIDRMTRHEEQLPVELLEQLERLRGKTEALMEGVRRFSHELRPSVLDQLGLAPALYWLADEMTGAHGVDTSMEAIGKARRFSPEAELVLFRIAQEALSNVRRHSKATRAQVHLEFAPGRLKLEVDDNGEGFEVPQMLSRLAAGKKLGMLSLQERVRSFGGTYALRSEPGQATAVSVEVNE